MAMQVFRETLPQPPVDRSNVNLQSWVDKVVTPWLEKRRDGVDETRYQFGAEPSVSASEAVVAHAVLGLLQEDTALELAHIPPPAELDKEPEVAEMFTVLIRNQAHPFVASALKEFRLCAKTSDDEGSELRRWAAFCHARFDRLRDAYAMQ